MIEVWEEFLHCTQNRLDLIGDLLSMKEAEIPVKRFMVRHARLMRLSPADVEILLDLLGGEA